MITLFWHLWHMGHAIDVRRVSVPMFDPGAKGWLYKCSCGMTYAR